MTSASARRALEFLDRALVMAGVSVWRVDLKTRRIYFNAVGFQLLGQHQDASGVDLDTYRDTIHPEDRAAIDQAAAQAVGNDQMVEALARYRDPDGSWRLLLTRRVAVRDELGEAVGLSGVSMDLSELQLQREHTRTFRERSHLAAEALGAGYFSRDDEEQVVHWDDHMMRLYGRTQDDGPLSRQRWLQEWVHPHDRKWLAERIEAADARWEPVSDLSFRIIDALGRVRWLQTWTRRVVHNGKRMSYGMHLDVTERHLAEEKAQHDSLRTRFVLEAAGVGVWECDLQGHEMVWNDGMYALRNCTRDDPRTLDQIMVATTDPDDYARLKVSFVRHLQEGEPYRGEVRLRLADGSTRWIWTEGQTLRDSQGQVVGVAGINLDMTERKRALQLLEEKQSLERAGQERSEFMARMSHELRTPMNAVQGFVRLMANDTEVPPLSDRQRERLARIDTASQRMMQMVDNLLQLAQRTEQQAGQQSIQQALQHAAPAVVPVVTGAAAGAVEPTPPPSMVLKVLCVEDNPVNLQLVRELLALRPAVVLQTAENGRQGIVAALADPPDLLLLDMQLPDINGLQVMKQLRAKPQTARCRIVALSADAMLDHISTALAAGFDDYWTKPIQFNAFLEHIDRLTMELGRPGVRGPQSSP